MCEGCLFVNTSTEALSAFFSVERLKFNSDAQNVPPRTIRIADGCISEIIAAESELCPNIIIKTASTIAIIAGKFNFKPLHPHTII